MARGKGKKNRKQLYTCVVCGSEFLGGNSRSVYCSKVCNQAAYRHKTRFDHTMRLRKLVWMAENRAKTKDVPFDITPEYMLDLWNKTDGCCAVTGLTFDLDKSDKGKVNPYAPSIDRIKPSLGYTRGNVRLICYQLNLAISEYGLDQFDNLVKAYVKNMTLIGQNYD